MDRPLTPNPNVNLRIAAVGVTDRGPNSEINCDAKLVSELSENPPYVFAIADGTGGGSGGEIAANKAINETRKAFENWMMNGWRWPEILPSKNSQRPIVEQVLERAVMAAHLSIQMRSFWKKALRQMGTTLTVAVIQDSTLFFSHVGHSRLYLFRNLSVEQLTRDHEYHPAEAPTLYLPADNRRFDVPANLLVPHLGGKYVTPEFGSRDLDQDDLLLMTTAGLTCGMSNGEIRTILAGKGTKAEKAKRLIETARRNGSKDDATVILAECKK